MAPRFLAPLWVLPEFQGRGVSTLLLKDVLDIADAQDPAIPIYLESVPEARKIYEHFGFEGFEDIPPGDGRELVIQSRWTVVSERKGTPKAILVVNTDITEKKKLESQLLRAQRLESIGTLASGLAHDLMQLPVRSL